MSRIAYVNGRYVRHRHAAVHIEDRGYQFADGVYEVIAVVEGHLVDAGPHLERLRRSLGELRIAAPMADRALAHVLRQVACRNRVCDGMVYLQVTRGIAARDHAFPAAAAPAVVVTARNHAGPPRALREKGCAVITVPDIRWERCDIKTTALVANVLAKQAARDAGAYEAWMIDAEGRVAEGSSTNAWIVTAAGRLLTRPADKAILNGITRRALLELAAEAGLDHEERGFTVAEAKAAREAFVTSTTAFVLPVVSIDGAPVGDGAPGPLTRKLMAAYRGRIARDIARAER